MDADVLITTQRFVFFWKPPAIFSQWALSPFVVDGVSYVCTEPFMGAK